jgi:hypothetical protein
MAERSGTAKSSDAKKVKITIKRLTHSKSIPIQANN